jgi:glycosyltransferase involved in cell wall biosynthesis
MFRFIKLCRRLKPELIHSSHYYTNIYAALGAFFSGCKAIGSIRASLKGLRKGYSAPVVALNNLFPRHLISNNQASIDDLKRHPSWNAPRKLSHIPNCVNLDDWPLHPFPARSSLRLIGVGSLVPVKNWEFMVEALYLFGKRAKFPWNCTIVGDGPLRSSLEEQIQRLELAEKIQLLGYRKDIGKLVGDSHLHLLTSTREGSPNAVLEALASGRPTLSVDVGEVPYLVSFGENGLVVPEGDMDAFVRTLLSIEGDFDRLQRMGAQARKRVEEQHSVSILIDSLEAIYKEEGIAP